MYNKKQAVFHQGDVLEAVTRPRWDSISNKHFDGKLGIWPFTIIETAKRNSRNSSAGTLVNQYCLMLMPHVLPAIKTKWPGNLSNTRSKIQQDNARPRIEPSDKEILHETFEMGLKVNLVFQPPNSPDHNVLGLGFFNKIQSIKHQYEPKNMEELVETFGTYFNQLHWTTINNNFLTLQKLVECIIL